MASSSEQAENIMSIQCGRCSKLVKVRPPATGAQFTFPCPFCGTENQASTSSSSASEQPPTMSVVCYRCRKMTQVRLPPQGGLFTFQCPGCNCCNRAQSPALTTVQCGQCHQQQQASLPVGQGAVGRFTCKFCNTPNEIHPRSVSQLMCTSCRQMTNVQAPTNGSDFTYSCPFCRATNRVKDHPREIVLTVPEGKKPGEEFQSSTPEGLKITATVPPGGGPGSTVKVEYRPRKHAQKVAQEGLPLHKTTAEEIERSPEDHKECAICLEAYKPGDVQTFLPCFHRFHHECAKGSLVQSTRCPLCNKDFHEAVLEGNQLLQQGRAQGGATGSSVTIAV